MSLKARIQKVSLIFACGTALFSDGYANGVIGSVLTRIYGEEALSHHNYSTVVRSVGFAGFVVGMILFGYLSDKMGRKFGMMSASALILLFSGLSASSSGAHGNVGGLLSMLSAMRFFLGIGLGAEYPCGSVSASEQSEEPGISKGAWHRWLALSTNTMIDFGFVIAAFVPLVLFRILGPNHLHAVWRLSLGLGIVPALGVFLWRLSMDEPVRYKKDSMKHARIPYILVWRRYGRSLAAISFVCWKLIHGISTHALLFPSVTGGSTDLNIVFGWNVIINLFYMPGTILGAFVIDYLGPKHTLIVGLLLQAIIGFFMSGFYLKLTNHIPAFAVVYGIFLSFGEFGPGNCTFILASKSCPTAVRGQFFGVAAATGKLGAFIGTWLFPPIIDAFGGPDSLRGNTGPFWIGSALALLSALVTFFFIQPLTPDGMAREDREFRAYLEVHGYGTSRMGLVHDTDLAEPRGSSEKVIIA
ncbi:putative metabolite transporter [Lyophyllum atratum]|nr:putative metabolite transporter [Lyophyllum atratum]